MNLTKAIREELANDLMIKAISKHAKRLGAEAVRLNKALEEQHLLHLARVMPEVPPARYAEMIQAGLLTFTISGAEVLYHPQRNEEGELSSTSNDPAHSVICKPSDEEKTCLNSSLRNNNAWSQFFSVFKVYTGYQHRGATLEMAPKLSRTLPDFRGRSHINFCTLEPEKAESGSEHAKEYIQAVQPIFADAQALSNEAAAIFAEGLAYRREVKQLLQACKTRKQLQELFPEAAALLPAPPPKRQDLAPTELAAQVRQRLIEGVPA